MVNIFRGIGHALAAITTNCSEFTSAWDNHAECKEIEGRWRGKWISEVNGHHGVLRCVLRQTDNDRLSAIFHAEYSRFLRVCYAVELRQIRSGDRFQLVGEADLGGLAGGVYRYEGELSQNHFVCNYSCRYDRGRFDLKPAGLPTRLSEYL